MPSALLSKAIILTSSPNNAYMVNTFTNTENQKLSNIFVRSGNLSLKLKYQYISSS